MAFLVGLGVFVACLVAGWDPDGSRPWAIGIVVVLASLPGAIVAWIKWNDRTYG